jgi:putative hemolysin
MNLAVHRHAAAGVAAVRACTNGVLKLLGIRGGPSRRDGRRDRRQLEEGLDAGVIEAQEHQMVRNVFRLDDRQIGSMMIPRAEITWLDATPRSTTCWR